MAKVSFNVATTQTAQTDRGRVGFFSLKNDGDEAIVRFMHNSVNDFEIYTVHDAVVNGKHRKINCLRESAADPIERCPLCESNTKIENKIFVHIMQYVVGSDGNVVAEPKVWERPMSYAQKLKGYIDNYGPLSDIICKVIRHGMAGSMQTTYEIIPNLNKQIYRDDIYPKHEEYFNNYSALGSIVIDRPYNEIKEFVITGNFPIREQQEQTNVSLDVPVQHEQPVINQQTWQQNINNNMQTTAYNPTSAPVVPQTMPWETPVQNTQQVQRPNRYY